jgi:hypothetical protein
MIPTDLEKVNPRYKAYCIFNKVSSPAEMWERDNNTGLGFIFWNTMMLNRWLKEAGKTKLFNEQDHEHFTDWLLEQAKKEAMRGEDEEYKGRI